jgi:hypothetical protein
MLPIGLLKCIGFGTIKKLGSTVCIRNVFGISRSNWDIILYLEGYSILGIPGTNNASTVNMPAYAKFIMLFQIICPEGE